jgi:hypothetical protein
MTGGIQADGHKRPAILRLLRLFVAAGTCLPCRCLATAGDTHEDTDSFRSLGQGKVGWQKGSRLLASLPLICGHIKKNKLALVKPAAAIFRAQV